MFTHLSRFGFSSRLRTLAGAALLALSGAAGALVAGDPIPPAAPVMPPVAPLAAKTGAKPIVISDVTLARAVLAAFDADPVLKDVNIIVSIVDRGAVIGGPVASDEIRKRAEAVVRGIAGIESVKNSCFVQADPDPLLRAAIERLKPGAKPATPAPLPGVAIAPAAPDNFIPPVPPLPPPDLLASGNNPKTSVSQSPSLPGTNVLGAPVSPNPSPKQPQVPSATPGALTGSTVVAKPADVQAAVAGVRKSDARYARLAVEVKPDGGLYVTGWSAKAKDAWDFAAELRKIPGVSHVAVDQNLVK